MDPLESIAGGVKGKQENDEPPFFVKPRLKTEIPTFTPL